MKLIRNEAVDFIFAMNRFAIRNKDNYLDYPQMDELKVWAKKYEEIVSPFLLNDISLIFEKTILISLYLFIKVQEKDDIKSANDFLNFLESFSPKEFKDDIIDKFLNQSIDKISVESIYNQIINDGLHPGYDEREEAQLLYGFLCDPNNFFVRLRDTYTQFYNQVYSVSKEEFKKLDINKYKWHSNKLSEDSILYLRTLGLNSIINEIKNIEELSLYYSFFADNDISALWDSKNIIIGAGSDKRIIQKSARKKSDLFFNCLGDPKRLEILRLTSERPWFSSELASYFNLKPATLSYHINKLVEADLLSIKKGEAKRFYYTLNEEAFELFLNYASQDLLKRDKKF